MFKFVYTKIYMHALLATHSRTDNKDDIGNDNIYAGIMIKIENNNIPKYSFPV